MLALQAREHGAEPLAVRVQVGLAMRPLDSAPSEHHRVEMAGKAEALEPRLAVRAERQPLEVLVVEVPVRHRHRLAPVPAHDRQRRGVVLGRKQRDLAADELGVLPRPAPLAQERHLGVDLADRVRAVDAHAVGVARVVAGRAGQVATREDAVRALAARGPAPEHLPVVLGARGQLRPPPLQRRLGVRMDGPGCQLDRPQAVADHRPASNVHSPLRCGSQPTGEPSSIWCGA